MGKIKETTIRRFDGGISDDIRQDSDRHFGLTQHFDTLTSPYKLSPFRDSETDNTTQVGISSFATDQTNLYALGVVAAGPNIRIYQKATQGGSWSTPSTSTSVAMTTVATNAGIIYTRGANRYYHMTEDGLNYWTIGGTYTDGTAQLTGLAVGNDGSINGGAANMVIHSRNNELFGAYSNSGTPTVWKVVGTAAPVLALTLPNNMQITSLIEYGNYLAIGCKPKSLGSSDELLNLTTSKVYLWDMSSSTAQETIDFGLGDLWVLGNVEGRLVGVMNEIDSADITFNPKKVYIKTWAGGTVSLFKTLSDTGLVLFGRFGYKPHLSTINGLTFALSSSGIKNPTGLYTVAKAGENYPFTVTMERSINNDTAPNSLVGFTRVGNVFYTAHTYVVNTSSSVNRTNDSATGFAATSAYVSQRFGCDNPRKQKKLLGITVTHEALPTAGTVVLKYMKDEETTFATTIYTHGTDNSLSHSAINIEATGGTLPVFREIQFRIESTGGAAITGLSFQYEELDNDLY